MKTSVLCFVACAALPLAGCTVPLAQPAVFDTGSAMQARAHQTRTFETADRSRALRAVLATLQDLGYVIDRVDSGLGLVHATKFDQHTFRATVSVQPGEANRTVVRVNAQWLGRGETGAGRALDEPAAYQDFFAALSRLLFLDAVPAS